MRLVRPQRVLGAGVDAVLRDVARGHGAAAVDRLAVAHAHRELGRLAGAHLIAAAPVVADRVRAAGGEGLGGATEYSLGGRYLRGDWFVHCACLGPAVLSCCGTLRGFMALPLLTGWPLRTLIVISAGWPARTCSPQP